MSFERFSNLGEGGGYIMGTWQVSLGLHTYVMHDGIYYEPLFIRVAQVSHTDYHSHCTHMTRLSLWTLKYNNPTNTYYRG